MGSIVIAIAVIAIVAPSYVFAIHLLLTEGSGIVIEFPKAAEVDKNADRWYGELWVLTPYGIEVLGNFAVDGSKPILSLSLNRLAPYVDLWNRMNKYGLTAVKNSH